MSSTKNPFEEFDIDPTAGTAAITETFRDLIEDTVDEKERTRLRKAWEVLTAHPDDRVLFALSAHPKGPSLPSSQDITQAPTQNDAPLTLSSLLGMPPLRESLSDGAQLQEGYTQLDSLADDPALITPATNKHTQE